MGFSNTKKDKRHIKHASFVSRIEKVQKSQSSKKTRRPGKKLKTNLDALADALPELEDGIGGEGERGQEGKIRHKSLKTRKGALKRKEKVVKGEVERFGVSLARLNAVGAASAAAVDASTGAQDMQVETESSSAGNANAEMQTTQTQQQQASSSTSTRWAALRGFISATMEQNPAFVGKQDGKS